MGIFSDFFQWFQITVGFVTMIYFILGSLSYVLNWPALNSNPLIKFIGVLIIFGMLTFSQFGGTKNTAKIAKIGFILGVLIPAIILFLLSIVYIVKGNLVHVNISSKTFIPNFSKINTLVIFVSFILAYMGVEASASHVNKLKNAKKNYLLAIFILVILAIILNTIGGLTVAAVIPAKQLNLSAGVVQAFHQLIFSDLGLKYGWLTRVLALLLAVGVISEVSAWVVGPSEGMCVAATKGILPKKLAETNKHNVPVPLILVQGGIVTIWAAILTFGGRGSNVSFLTAISLTVIIYLIGYLLFFLGYFTLLFKYKDLKRAYNVPGGQVVKFIVAFFGMLTSILALVISFFPPSQLSNNNALEYIIILSLSFIITILIPFIIYLLHHKWSSNKI